MTPTYPTYRTSLCLSSHGIRHSIFLASFLIWPTKSTLALCVCVSVCVPRVLCPRMCTIWYFYKLQIHTRTHTPPPPTRRTCVFNLCALIIHNSINANKLTLSKKLYRFSYSFLRLFFSFLSLPLCWANNPVSIWVLHIYVVYVCREGWTHQLHCRGINLSDFYVNSIHFIYSTI